MNYIRLVLSFIVTYLYFDFLPMRENPNAAQCMEYSFNDSGVGDCIAYSLVSGLYFVITISLYVFLLNYWVYKKKYSYIQNISYTTIYFTIGSLLISESATAVIYGVFFGSIIGIILGYVKENK